jgi:predicted CoA-substrate-specific enzyme activase
MNPLFTGIDAGSVSAKIAIIGDNREIRHSAYVLHRGDPLGAASRLSRDAEAGGFSECMSLAVTGSARKITARSAHADIVKNEITALWRAVTEKHPDARTIIEIGGQDSKLISLSHGEIDSFKLNSVCAAGTGSFIQQQASRLGIDIEEFSSLGLDSGERARFTGRCTVFVETEMINLQQSGYSLQSIAAGLSDAICENYLKDLSPGINLEPPFIFCGGVAGIESIAKAFGRRLGREMIRPSFYRIAGAYGAALLARDHAGKKATEIRKIAFEPIRKKIAFREGTCADCLMCGKCRERQ